MNNKEKKSRGKKIEDSKSEAISGGVGDVSTDVTARDVEATFGYKRDDHSKKVDVNGNVGGGISM